MATGIKDVAKVAGVSIATVSRVINNAPNVHPDIKKNVMQVINKLNYEPNKIAQSLSGSPFKSIGLTISRSSNTEYTSQIISSINNSLAEAHYTLTLTNSKTEKEEIQQCLSMIRSKIVQGFILIGSKNHDLLIETLHEKHVPFVVIGKIASPHLVDSVYHIDTDNLNDCTEAIKYVFSLGHKRIACMHSDLTYTVNKERLEGYIQAHKEKNVPVNYNYICDAGFNVEDACKAATALLSMDKRPTAIFATDDIKAMGCYKAAHDLQLKIPQDISILGHNNYDITQLTTPALTTIDVPVTELGKMAAKILCAIIKKEAAQIKTLLPTKLIIRKSCSTPSNA